MVNNTHYAVLGPLRIDGMTAQNPDIVAGFPAPAAVAGLGHKVTLDLAKAFGPVVHLGTAAILHDHSVMKGHVKLPLEDKAKIRDAAGAPILDERRARVTASLVIAFSATADSQQIKTFLASNIPGLVFGGGKVFPAHGDLLELVSMPEDFDALRQELVRLPPGFVLLDRTDLLKSVAADDARDPLDALLDVVEARKVTLSDDTVRFERARSGWFVPVFVGYQAIERRQGRKGLRAPQSVGHVFAESLYSLGEFRSVRSLLKSSPDALRGAFWKHNHNKSSETYFVSATI